MTVAWQRSRNSMPKRRQATGETPCLGIHEGKQSPMEWQMSCMIQFVYCIAIWEMRAGRCQRAPGALAGGCGSVSNRSPSSSRAMRQRRRLLGSNPHITGVSWQSSS